MAKLIEQFVHPKNRRLRVQLRDDSKFLQALVFFNGRKHQQSMETDHLPTAFRLADDWLKKLKRESAGEPVSRLMEIPISSELTWDIEPSGRVGSQAKDVIPPP